MCARHRPTPSLRHATAAIVIFSRPHLLRAGARVRYQASHRVPQMLERQTHWTPSLSGSPESRSMNAMKSGNVRTKRRERAAAGVRHVPIELALRPLLEALRPASGKGPVIAMGPMEDWAERLRRHLGTAKIDERRSSTTPRLTSRSRATTCGQRASRGAACGRTTDARSSRRPATRSTTPRTATSGRRGCSWVASASRFLRSRRTSWAKVLITGVDHTAPPGALRRPF